MRPSDLALGLRQACAAGVLTCTRGKPGEPGATYALAWLPLDRPEQFTQAVRDQHEKNRQQLLADAPPRKPKTHKGN